MTGKLETSIVLAGVGGQGTLIAGKLLGILSMKLGLDVKVSEVHGMSQRGGSVITYVKIGERVNSSIVEEGTADYVLAFEELEAVRWAGLVKKGGRIIINTKKIMPLPVLLGKAEYPEHIRERLVSAVKDGTEILEVDAVKIAEEAGSGKAVNMAMLGALSESFPVSDEMWISAIEEAFSSKAKLIPVNKAAFEAGRKAIL